MGKKAFIRALKLVRSGHLAEAIEQLATVDSAFIRKRLTHYKMQPDNREAALQLEAALELVSKRTPKAAPATTPVAFEAPLPPDTIDTAPTNPITFDDPIPFLTWASADWDRVPELRLNNLSYTDIWPLVALA
ncbi:MAG TPA: hypothetical protein VLS89_14135, partial [Candidatus Nanopelagicales bacterium]|nr:hypothetical protein [Candidatus Nanopelagicales bacterium]